MKLNQTAINQIKVKIRTGAAPIFFLILEIKLKKLLPIISILTTVNPVINLKFSNDGSTTPLLETKRESTYDLRNLEKNTYKKVLPRFLVGAVSHNF